VYRLIKMDVEHPFTPKVLHEVGRDEKSGKRMEK
jgi:hypothetical protein